MHNKTIHRCKKNPVITINDVTPTEENLHVVGVFNCGGVQIEGKTYLICRTAEMLKAPSEGILAVPVIDQNKQLSSLIFDLSDSSLDFFDNRVIIENKTKKVVALTSLSSFRLAISEDGIHFTIGKKPFIPFNPFLEEWGMEDPRVTLLEKKFYITYSSVSRHGVGVSMTSSNDFINFEKMGMILPPPNKDTVLFPEKINEKYYILHRPSLEGGAIGNSNVWISDSTDLVHWGNHIPLFGCETGNEWENKKIGAGAPPIRIPQGWLVLYHGVDAQDRYSMGAVILDHDDPSIILSRSTHPILEPEMNYEISGFFAHTVFPCTAFLNGNNVVIYYGAADNSICRVDIPLITFLE